MVIIAIKRNKHSIEIASPDVIFVHTRFVRKEDGTVSIGIFSYIHDIFRSVFQTAYIHVAEFLTCFEKDLVLKIIVEVGAGNGPGFNAFKPVIPSAILQNSTAYFPTGI